MCYKKLKLHLTTLRTKYVSTIENKPVQFF